MYIKKACIITFIFMLSICMCPTGVHAGEPGAYNSKFIQGLKATGVIRTIPPLCFDVSRKAHQPMPELTIEEHQDLCGLHRCLDEVDRVNDIVVRHIVWFEEDVLKVGASDRKIITRTPTASTIYKAPYDDTRQQLSDALTDKVYEFKDLVQCRAAYHDQLEKRWSISSEQSVYEKAKRDKHVIMDALLDFLKKDYGQAQLQKFEVVHHMMMSLMHSMVDPNQ